MSDLRFWMCILAYLLLSYIGVALYFRVAGKPPTEYHLGILVLAPFVFPFGVFAVTFLLFIYLFICLAWGDKIKG